MLNLLQHPIPLALVAAVPGAIHGWLNGAKKSPWRGVSDAITAMIFAAAIAELYTPPDKPVIALLIGLVAGRTGAKVLEALEEAMPRAAKNLLEDWARRLLGLPPSSGETYTEDDDAEDTRNTDQEN